MLRSPHGSRQVRKIECRQVPSTGEVSGDQESHRSEGLPTPTLDDTVSSFLHLGYVPNSRTDGLVQRLAGAVATRPSHPPSRADAVHVGGQLLRAAFPPVENTLHIVPLSGGLDSRAILAALIDLGARENVVAVTFGTPGTLDFDIGVAVARKAGVRLEVIDLTTVRIAYEPLEAALLEGPGCSMAFDRYYNRLISDHFGPDATYWSGFLGGELAGSHVPRHPVRSWEEALAGFVALNRMCHLPLAKPAFSPQSVLPTEPLVERSVLSYPDQLDFGVRQEFYIAPTLLRPGYRFRTPFLDPDWASFILQAPLEQRREERLYKRIVRAEFPELFSLPTKATYGLTLDAPEWMVRVRARTMGRRPVIPGRRPPPLVNYVDFSTALRRRGAIRELVREAIVDLAARDVVPWLDVLRLWRDHEKGTLRRYDGAIALTLLASLEWNIRVDGRRPVKFFTLRAGDPPVS